MRTSKWIISSSRGEDKEYLKPPPGTWLEGRGEETHENRLRIFYQKNLSHVWIDKYDKQLQDS